MVSHYQTGRGTLCSLDNDASIRTATQDRSTVTCTHCLYLINLREQNAAKGFCPHGMVLADNVCGPCSEGRPNRCVNWPCALPSRHEGPCSTSDAAAEPPTYTALHYVGKGPLPNCDACGHCAQMHSPPNYGRCPSKPGTGVES